MPDCKGCRHGVYSTIAKIDGVERATVDSKASVVTAWIDAAKTNREVLIAALKKGRVEFPSD
jgi:copper chaperone CopZ